LTPYGKRSDNVGELDGEKNISGFQGIRVKNSSLVSRALGLKKQLWFPGH